MSPQFPSSDYLNTNVPAIKSVLMKSDQDAQDQCSLIFANNFYSWFYVIF